MFGSPFFDCESFGGERRFGLGGRPLGPDGVPLERQVSLPGLTRNAARNASILGSAPRLPDVGRVDGAPLARVSPAPAGVALDGRRREVGRADREKATPVSEVTSTRGTPVPRMPLVSPGPRRAAAPGAGERIVTSGPGSRQLAGLFDSGAGATFLTSAHGRLWPHRGVGSISATDAQGNLFVAHGGAALWGRMRTADGRDVVKLVSKRAYVSDSVAESPIAYSDMCDVGWRFVDSFDSSPSLVDHVGDSVALTRDGDGHLWLEFDVTAAPSSAPDQSAAGLPVGDAQVGDGAWADAPFDGPGDTRAAAVPTRTPLRPRRPGGAGPGFTWPGMPPAGWSSDGSSATDGPAQPRRSADVGDSPVGDPAKAGAPASGVAAGV